MVKRFTVILILALAGPVLSAKAEPNDGSLEKLLFMEIPSVLTASKQEQTIENAPSVISVITQQDIAVKGYRSVEDALFRVVGFFPQRQFTWNGILANRGLVQDKNSHYLFLVDGHSINNIDDEQNQTYQFPTIDKVKQIEIVRGPGSTLWGSDAALGIINIITKDGADINGLKVNTDIDSFSGGGNNYSTNLLYGKRASEDSDIMLSATIWSGAGWKSKNQFPWSSSYAESIPIQAYDDSLDMYGKVRNGEFTFKGGYTRGKDTMGWASSPDFSDRTANIWEYFWLEAQNNHQFNDSLNLEVKLFTDHMQNTYFLDKAASDITPNNSGEYSALPANDIGAEAMLSGKSSVHQWKAGIRFVKTYTGPSIGERTYVTNGIYYVGDAGNNKLLYLKDGVDNLAGVYAEDQWQMSDKFVGVLGGRLDHDDLRENGSQFMPRAALIYKTNEEMTLKYLYNTGYVRPSLFQAANLRFVDVTQSESIQSHDLQALFQTKNTQVTATLFLMHIKNYITWIDVASVANTVLINLGTNGNGNYNVGDFDSKGFELEFKKKLGEVLSVYGNYSYAVAKLGSDLRSLGIVNDYGSWHGVPQQIYNLGTDIFPSKHITCNINVRVWTDITAKKTATTYWTLAGGKDLDVSLAYNQIAGTPLWASLYCFNVLDNDMPIADANVGGPASPKPRMISLKVGYSF